MAGGGYTAHMLLHSRRVIGFEPNPQSAQELRSMFRGTRAVRVEQVALSDSSGMAPMWFPTGRPMLCSLESPKSLPYLWDPAFLPKCSLNEITVNRRTLDSYDLHSVGFVKIDVDGHEVSLLRGALSTLLREKPRVLVEIQGWNLPEVSAIFRELNYTGHFMYGAFRTVRPLSSFDPEIHQRPKPGLFINNFIFLPPGAAASFPMVAPRL